MSAGYAAVLWNKNKKKYDIILWIFIVAFIVISFVINLVLFPEYNIATLIIRSFGLLSLVLLHIILSIGPLCRINNKFLPLLYNRRHLGVSMFLVASVHALYSIFWFHTNGNVHPLLSVFTSNIHYASFLFFPFQTLGFFAYIILMLMAFTSHDFWLAALTPKVWKSLHMMVYAAYFLVILHVVLGVLQLENNPVTYIFILSGMIFLAVVHIAAGIKSYRFDNKKNEMLDGWQFVSTVDEIDECKAKMLNVNGERVAVFKYEGKLSAVHNVCKHQNGPLGEGKIVDGCITCPWHGYQYKPADGCSPEPFTEKVATYQVKLIQNKIYVNPYALPEGTFIQPLFISETKEKTSQENFYIGWLGNIDTSTTLALKRFIFPAVLTSLLFLISFSFTQKKIAFAQYHFNEEAEYEGTVSNFPFPHILFLKAKDGVGNPLFEAVPLVNAWKCGADSLISMYCKKKANCSAKIKGTLISRDSVCALELTEKMNAFQNISTQNFDYVVELEPLGTRKIKAEIIDPKCYLGAMNPGEGKPHRSCAVRCISGGIMPMITFDDKGKKEYAVLLGENGEKINQQVLDFVAEPVEVEGELFQYANWKVLKINTQKITRLKN